MNANILSSNPSSPLSIGVKDDSSYSNDREGLLLGPSLHDVEIDGMEINEAAHALGVGVDDIWRRIRNGQVIARTNLGRVFVYSDAEKYRTAVDFIQLESLPPLPKFDSEELLIESDLTVTEIYPTERSIAEVSIESARFDLSAIVQHLNLAKEENREIIKFTNDSMSRLTQMTDELLKMKDEVIHAREEQVADLSQQVEQSSAELRRLVKENENLATIAKFLDQNLLA